MIDETVALESACVPAIGGTEVRKPGYSIYLLIPANHLECRCSYVPHEQGKMLTSDELNEIFVLHGVLQGIDHEACENFIISAAAGRQQINLLVASGTPPVDGTDEYFMQTVPTSTEIHCGEDESTRADMYIVQTLVNVSIGEEIGRIISAEPGIPGLNIMGAPIPPQPGKPLKFKIGKNICVEEEGTLLIAAATGRFCQLAGEFSVEEEFVVKGDVDFHVGIIDFKGFVEVRGDVLDHFGITASKGLSVTGNIGVCHIVSDGDITFCGMDGQGTGSIRCGGMLRAQYIHDTDIECTGDVIVNVEIHDCCIKTLGRIVVNKDTISGGSCIALRGIEANKLGSPSAIHTHLLVGVDYRYVNELQTLLEELLATQCEIREARSLDEVTALRKTATRLSERIAHIRGKVIAAANAKVNVKAALHENVRIGVGDVIQTVNEIKDGPLTIVENIIDGGLSFIPMTGLDVRATDIQLAFIQDQKLALEARDAAKLKIKQ